MTQPDPVKGTVDWFWGLACVMLKEHGRFTEIIADKYEMSEPPLSYVPKCFIVTGVPLLDRATRDTLNRICIRRVHE